MKLKDIGSLEEKLEQTSLNSILKSRDITLPIKVRLVKALVFPVVTYGCESCTVKKAKHQRSDVSELWCWRTLEGPLDSKEIKPVHPKGDQSWVFTGSTDVEAEAPILWPLMWTTNSFEKTLIMGEIEGRRRRGWQRMRWLDGITEGHEFEQTLGDGEGQESLACCSPWGHKEWDKT